MKYKILAIDVDGTLVNSQGIILPSTIKAIREAEMAGVIVIICTGRPYQGIKKIIEILNLKTPAILYNGAMIVDTSIEQVLYHTKLLNSDANLIIDMGNNMHTTMCIWSNNQLYCNVINDNVNTYKKQSGVEPQLINSKLELINKGITKILWYDKPDRIADFELTLNKIGLNSTTFCKSKSDYLEIYNSKTSKAIALKYICNMYKIDTNNILAIGDSFNDISMLEFAGFSVAMGNSPPDIKNIVNYITLSNDEDAIYDVIHKYII